MGASALLAGCGHFGKPGAECGPEGCPDGAACHAHVDSCTEPTLMALGRDLDHLEKHIDWFGSATAKAPDVWGQARLTQYREQFDKLMDPEEPGNNLEFALSLQGSIARSDQAFFAQAAALSFAAQPKPPAVGSTTSVKAAPPELVPASGDVVVVAEKEDTSRKGDKTAGKPEATEKLGTAPATDAPKAEKPAEEPKADGGLSAYYTGDNRGVETDLLAGRGIGFTKLKTDGIGIEPTLMVAQKKRYLDFLNQLRRENEGDDTADSPGYALHLVRVPVSVLPGKRTDEGYGAEVTMTITPTLGDDLLPMTFRNLVTNDLVKTLGFPLTKFLDEDRERAPGNRFLTEAFRTDLRAAEFYDLLEASAPAEADGVVRAAFTAPKYRNQSPVSPTVDAPPGSEALPPPAQLYRNNPGAVPDAAPAARYRRVSKFRQDMESLVASTHLSFTNAGQDREPFPTSQLLNIYGAVFSFEIAFTANQALQREMAVAGYAHLPAVQSFLREESRAAYHLLALPTSRPLWDEFCTPEVVGLIRTQNWEVLDVKRRHFRDRVQALTGSKPISLTLKPGTADQLLPNPVRETRQMQITAALAWGILVDSALLTERLMRDMRETASAKGKGLPHCEAWLPYYLPDPPPEARCAFRDYVALRWPARVFALDPYTQDQNIADQFSARRETQLALSIAFTNGFIGANTLTRYARRLEADYETVALNRPQVGFSHGENVFGWRFTPRFQTPETEANLTVLVRDQLIGGPSRAALARRQRLEPGPRECVAVVMMPTFVPYATLDVTTNWFGLANPKHKVLDHTQALKLSRTVQAIKTCGPGAASDAACYRDGEFPRLLRRAEQLEARLPTQTLAVPLPAANTLGGFEMFSNGTTDLAPELYGWYGAPGVNRDGTTTLFLVGDHFSPLHTKVIIGNKPATRTLLSRQVMRVSVKGPLLTVTDPRAKRLYVQAHVATPYGVTRELLIPAVALVPAAAKAPAEGYAVTSGDLTLPYCKKFNYTGGGYFLGLNQADYPAAAKLTLRWDDNLGDAPAKADVLLDFSANDCTYTSVVEGVAIKGDTLTVDAGQLKKAVRDLFKTLNGRGAYTDATSPIPNGLTLAKVRVRPTDPKRAAQAVAASGTPVIKFEGCDCKADAEAPGVSGKLLNTAP